jgi:hypothetical protein
MVAPTVILAALLLNVFAAQSADETGMGVQADSFITRFEPPVPVRWEKPPPPADKVTKPKRWVDVFEYYRRDDLSEASAQLLIDAQAVGLDIERKGPEFEGVPSEKVKTPVAEIPGDSLSLPRSDEMDSERTFVLVIQPTRRLSISEHSELMSLGIRAYQGSGSTIIAVAQGSTIPDLRSKPYIRWIGLYKPEYKIVDVPYEKRVGLGFIEPLDRAPNDDERSDLEGMGIEVVDVLDRHFFVDLRPGDAARVSMLPWVRGVFFREEINWE